MKFFSFIFFLLILMLLTFMPVRGEIDLERLWKMFWPRTSLLSPLYIPLFSFLLRWILKECHQKYVWLIFFWISTLFASYEMGFFYHVLTRMNSAEIKDMMALFYGVSEELFLWISTSLLMVFFTFWGMDILKVK